MAYSVYGLHSYGLYRYQLYSPQTIATDSDVFLAYVYPLHYNAIAPAERRHVE